MQFEMGTHWSTLAGPSRAERWERKTLLHPFASWHQVEPNALRTLTNGRWPGRPPSAPPCLALQAPNRWAPTLVTDLNDLAAAHVLQAVLLHHAQPGSVLALRALCLRRETHDHWLWCKVQVAAVQGQGL